MPTFIGLDLAWTTHRESGICWFEGETPADLRCTPPRSRRLRHRVPCRRGRGRRGAGRRRHRRAPPLHPAALGPSARSPVASDATRHRRTRRTTPCARGTRPESTLGRRWNNVASPLPRSPFWRGTAPCVLQSRSTPIPPTCASLASPSACPTNRRLAAASRSGKGSCSSTRLTCGPSSNGRHLASSTASMWPAHSHPRLRRVRGAPP